MRTQSPYMEPNGPNALKNENIKGFTSSMWFIRELYETVKSDMFF
jgi:hypothetical protein